MVGVIAGRLTNQKSPLRDRDIKRRPARARLGPRQPPAVPAEKFRIGVGAESLRLCDQRADNPPGPL